MDRGSTSEIRGAVTMDLGTNESSRWAWADRDATRNMEKGVICVGEYNRRKELSVGHDWRGWRLVEACSFPIGDEPVVLVRGHDGVVALMQLASG
jgi:hypothetical protein